MRKLTKLYIVAALIIILLVSMLTIFYRKSNNKMHKNLFALLGILVVVGPAVTFGIKFTTKKPAKLPSENAYIIDNDEDVKVIKIKEDTLIDAPIIDQFPELPRGCEVTSLAMLLQYVDVDVDKMTLAKQVKKDPASYQVKDGEINFGHPNYGFVGNMYTYEKPGLGVYHKPIKELAEHYLPGKIIDLTGSHFDEIKVHLSDGRPVWVIINTAYDKLPDSYFQTWQTDHGEIDITYKEHSVLITGYDGKYIYFNDPLIGKKNRQEPIDGFIRAWKQMGRQAITYLP